MAQSISASVGAWEKQAPNLRDDVTTVQRLLKAAAESTARPELDPGAVDGRIARPPHRSATVEAIRAFQRVYLHGDADGLVEPGKNTMHRLARFEPIPKPTAAIAPPRVTGGGSFPFTFMPHESYKSGGRRFGALRAEGKRLHAGCDLFAPIDTPIHAVKGGTVYEATGREFYHGTFSLAVDHGDFLVRYCEVKSYASGITKDQPVAQGQVIAYVGKMLRDSMLHLEVYQGTGTGPLTQRHNKQYDLLDPTFVAQAASKSVRGSFERRSDLLDPTPYLDIWRNNLPR